MNTQDRTGGEQSAIGQRRRAALARPKDSYHERRNQIIRTAATLFKDRGYDGTSLGDIAEAVGADRATLYYYVGSKAEIFDELVTDLVIQGLEEVKAIHASSDPPPVKLRRLVTSIMEAYARHYPFLYVYLQENLAHVEEQRRAWATEMRRVNQEWAAVVEAIVQEGFDDGSLRPIASARVISYGLIGTVSWTNRWFDPTESPLDASTIGEAYAEMLLHGLAPSSGEPASRQ